MADVADDREESQSDSNTFSVEEWAQQSLPALDASDEDKAGYVVARWAVQDDHYRGLYQLWTKVLYFLVGKQWIKWNESATAFEPDSDVPEWRQQPVTNFTYAIFRTAVAKLTKNRPTLDVVPPSGDSEDREAAQLGEAVLEFLWRYIKHPQKLIRAVGWFVCTGNVYLDADWDEEAGRTKPRTVLVEIAHPDDPTQTLDVDCPCDEHGEAYRRDAQDETDVALDGGKPYDFDREPDVEPEGEVSIDVDDPFSVRFNPDATSPEEADEWTIARLWPTASVCEYFDVEPDELRIDTQGAGEMREEFDDAHSRVTASAPDPWNNGESVTGADQAEGIGARTMVYYFYRQPNAKKGFPKGRHFIVAGHKKVWPPDDDPDYPNGEAPLPFGFWPPRVPIIDTPIPGQPQGLGMLTQVVPLNEALNHLDGKILEHHVTMAMGGIWFVHPSDKGIVITSEPGQVKVSKGMEAGGKAAAPFQAQMQALPAQVYQEREVLMSKMRTVAGMSDVDLSQRPEGVTAGRAFLVLQEASDAAITTGLQAIEHGLEELGRRELVIVREKYTDERTIKIKGEKGQYLFRSFKGADLRDGLDVRVQAGSSFPWNKSAQWDTRLSVIQSLPQLVLKADGTVDKEALNKVLEPAGSGMVAFQADENSDLVEIQREHAQFEAYDPSNPELSNVLPELAAWQTHPIHLQQHYDFMKRSFARFLRWSPPAQAAFIEHMRETAVAVDAIAQQLVPNPPPALTTGAAPSEAGGGDAGLVPPGGETGRQNTPTARPKQSQLRLTRGDHAAAGQ